MVYVIVQLLPGGMESMLGPGQHTVSILNLCVVPSLPEEPGTASPILFWLSSAGSDR